MQTARYTQCQVGLQRFHETIQTVSSEYVHTLVYSCSENSTVLVKLHQNIFMGGKVGHGEANRRLATNAECT